MAKMAKVIQHVAFEDLGSLHISLIQQGYTIQYYHATQLDTSEWFDPYDLLIILGGPIGAYQDKEYPFLNTEIDMIQYRLSHKMPILGICLGAQLIVRAMGSHVYPGSQKEIGWSAITTNNDEHHLFMRELTDLDNKVLHWHGDTFDIPDGAVRLASSSVYPNQAFAVDDYCLALQFHPEVTRSGMEHWFVGHALEIEKTDGITVEQLRADTQRYADQLAHRASQFWHQWLGSLEN